MSLSRRTDLCPRIMIALQLLLMRVRLFIGIKIAGVTFYGILFFFSEVSKILMIILQDHKPKGSLVGKASDFSLCHCGYIIRCEDIISFPAGYMAVIALLNNMQLDIAEAGGFTCSIDYC